MRTGAGQRKLSRAMLVSVLMPVFNAAATLPGALASIRRQRGVELECVLVDDGSSDGSVACLQREAALDPRLRVHAIEHRGIVGALQHGLERCRGQYVARMDADDIMHSERLAAQVALLEAQPELAGAGCHVRLFPRLPPAQQARSEYERWLNSLHGANDVARERFIECPLAHPTWMLRREVFQRLGYRDMGWPEDYDLLLRLLGSGHALGVVPRRLLLWRDSPERLSRSSETYAQARFVAVKAHHLASTWLARHRRYVLWGYGETGRALCRALQRYERHPQAIVEVHPGRLGQRIHGAPVIAPEQLLAARRGPEGPLPVVVSVARSAPRALVRAALERLELREQHDFVCAA
ncbi:MAG TPA: glycosyltransferase family 2 protein [Polyangiaceae bacterium]|nr:glycosyltransferase family 2 protein [Polyangiaceae bacterium]